MCTYACQIYFNKLIALHVTGGVNIYVADYIVSINGFARTHTHMFIASMLDIHYPIDRCVCVCMCV